VLLLPRLRQAMGRDALVLRGAIVQAAATAVMSVAPNAWVAVPAMFMGGMAWITTANSLSVSAQLSLPDWVRARGRATYQMAIMGASAFGAALWGQVATVSSLRVALLTAAVSGVLMMLLALRFVNDPQDEDDVTPARQGWASGPPATRPEEEGRVVITIEYHIDPARAEAFKRVMEETRRVRLSQGAIDWALLHHVSEPSRYVEQIVDESWTEHLRRFARATAADITLRERRLAFHVGEGAPAVNRFIVQR